MNLVRKIGLAVLLVAAGLFVLPSQVSASDYVFSNGFYWSGGQAFTRVKVLSKQCINGTCRQVYTYQYQLVNPQPQVEVEVPAAPVPATPEASSSYGWREQLLRLAEQREKYELQVRRSAEEHREFLEAINALGIQAGLAGPGYTHVTGGQYSADGSAYVQQALPQGSTVYGYSAAADVYGDVDLGALYQQALRLAEQSTEYGSVATANATSLIQQEGNNRARVAEILARGQAAREALESTRLGSEAHVRIQGTTSGQSQVQAQVQSGPLPELGAVVQNSCVKCHGGEKTLGNLNMTDLSSIDAAMGRKILERIVNPDPEMRMPPEQPLTAREIMTFFQHIDPAVLESGDE